MAVLGQARLFLGNESGPMHMAAAAGTSVVGLFGLTDPAVSGPVGVANVTLRPSIPCECIARGLCRRPDPSKACRVWRLD
ncbi:glycosyltransferase family 9 protein [Mesorhizobium sp. M0220]|uniref:glycosyltransferase family 9 protein n=1 Tax=Mesorhizobium sp. M0220 TaxID=2956920 RepID=UPI00333A74DA